MSSHIRTFLTGVFALLTALLLTLAPAAALTDTAVRSVKEGALQTAIYGGSFKDNVLNSATQIMVNDATGVLQDGIGDVKDAQRWGEGSVPGALLHGGVGGLASLAKDGDFAAGFVTSAGAEFTTAFVHGQTGGDQSRTGDIIRKYGNPTLAALTSGGDINQYSINQGIADSQLKNNYYGQHEANGPEKYEEYARENCQNLSPTECSDKYYEGAFTGVRMILDEVPFVGEGIAGYEYWSGPGAGTCAGILVGIIPFGKRGLDIVKEGAEQLRKKGADDVVDNSKTYQTYTKTNEQTGEIYCGRTSGCGNPTENVAVRDQNHHKNSDGFGPALLDRSSTNPDAIRGREQQMIDANGGAKSQGGTSGNVIQGIANTNPKRDQYLDGATEEFGVIHD